MDTPDEKNELKPTDGKSEASQPGDTIDATESSGISGESLESSDNNSSTDGTGTTSGDATILKTKQTFGSRVRSIASKVNIYLLLFILIIIMTVMVAVVSMQRSRKESDNKPADSQSLTQEQLKQLSSSESKVGDPKQTLNIESNAVFTGKVLVRDSLDVAGGIKIGGSLSVPGITVSGTSVFDTVQLNNLTASGNASIQGQLTVQKGLTVAGGASFSGPLSAPQITISTLQLNGDLQLNRHIDAGGNTPGKSDGSALGIGGTASVSGTDSAGTVTINTGGNPPAGCYITVNFAQKFNGTPHVVITPVGSAASGLNYYITRTTTNFSICAMNSAPASTTFAFDYIALD